MAGTLLELRTSGGNSGSRRCSRESGGLCLRAHFLNPRLEILPKIAAKEREEPYSLVSSGAISTLKCSGSRSSGMRPPTYHWRMTITKTKAARVIHT